MKKILRFLGMMAIAMMVAFLISCTQKQANTPTSSVSSPNSANPSEVQPSGSMSGHMMTGKTKINLNTALLSELDKLEAKLASPALSNKIQASRP